MSRVLAFAVSCLGLFAATGCSSAADTGSSSAALDAARDDGGGEDVHDDSADATAPIDAGPPACWFVKSARAEERKCDDCSDVQCRTERESCYGPGYLGGTFTGVCQAYITCQCGCREDDDVCQQACKIEASKDCDTCATKIANCENTKCASTCAPGL